MRFLDLVPGAGNFHCGNCVREQTLAAGLRRLGHDALIAPLYLPLVGDHDEPQQQPVRFGGVNVYLQQASALFRHTPAWLDKLFDAPALLRMAAKKAGMTQAASLGALTLSTLQGEQGNQRKEVDKLAQWIAQEAKPDVVNISNCLLLGLARQIRQQLKCKIICTLHGEDAFLDSLAEPWRTRAWATLKERASDVDHFIAVSQWYLDRIGPRIGLDPRRATVVHNGVEVPDPQAPAAQASAPVIGYLARLHPSKGLHTLVDAFILLRRKPALPAVQLHIGGAATPSDQPYIDIQKRKLAEAGLAGDVSWKANLTREQKHEHLRNLTVLSVPATYGEAFGLYVIEAWAAGVPVVQPRSGAFPELLSLAGGGVLCEPDDAGALADALSLLVSDRQRARELGAAGRAAVLERFTADRMAAQVARICESLPTHAGSA